MPIPQRPLPRRPGHAVPHKPRSTLTPTSANTLDWRAEVAFLDSFAHSRGARSVPSPGVAIMDAAARAKERAAEAASSVGNGGKGREVGLEELIQDGKGKREKRATTAATLGFDFIHAPAVLVLPDTPSPAKLSTPSKAQRSTTPSPLASTPQTPGLISSSALSIPRSTTSGRARSSSADEVEAEDDSDLDEWEHVYHAADDEEELVLGELELEDRDEMGGVSLVDRKEAVGMRRVDGVSYAAALGAR